MLGAIQVKGGVMEPNDHGKQATGETVWSKPVIEDFGVAGVTEHRFTSGIDNYEADNPVNYGS